jgi:hypothetical protein
MFHTQIDLTLHLLPFFCLASGDEEEFFYESISSHVSQSIPKDVGSSIWGTCFIITVFGDVWGTSLPAASPNAAPKLFKILKYSFVYIFISIERRNIPQTNT